MNITPTTTLPKPPRLRADGGGYDWREFDRWLQRLFLILGYPNETNSDINLFQGNEDIKSSLFADFAVDHQHEIRQLSIKLDEIQNELAMITDQQNEILKLRQQVEDAQLAADMGA